MTPFEEYIFGIVNELQDSRVAEHKFPEHVDLHSIQKRIHDDVKATLNGFVKDGKMSWCHNVNGIPMFKTNTDK